MRFKKVKVAIYSGVIPSTTFIERLIRSVAQAGVRVYLFGTLLKPVKYPNLPVILVSNYPGWRGWLQTLFRMARLGVTQPSRLWQLRSYLRETGASGWSALKLWQKYVPVMLYMPDIFHVQWAKACGDWVFLSKFGVKLVLSLRGAHINYSPLADPALAEMYREVLPRYHRFHAVSHAIAHEAGRWGVPADRINVIYSGLIPSHELPAMLPFSEPIALLAVGRMHWKKGYHFLFDAMALLQAEGHSVSLTLIAQGNMTEELMFQLHQLGLEKEVRWIPGLPHEDVLKEMQKHHLLVLPSVEEGIPNVVLEAMNQGLLVVATACGGLTEVIHHGRNGWLVPVRNAEKLKETILEASATVDRDRAAMRLEAWKTVRDQFNEQIVRLSFQNFYQEAISCELL